MKATFNWGGRRGGREEHKGKNALTAKSIPFEDGAPSRAGQSRCPRPHGGPEAAGSPVHHLAAEASWTRMWGPGSQSELGTLPPPRASAQTPLDSPREGQGPPPLAARRAHWLGVGFGPQGMSPGPAGSEPRCKLLLNTEIYHKRNLFFVRKGAEKGKRGGRALLGSTGA